MSCGVSACGIAGAVAAQRRRHHTAMVFAASCLLDLAMGSSAWPTREREKVVVAGAMRPAGRLYADHRGDAAGIPVSPSRRDQQEISKNLCMLTCLAFLAQADAQQKATASGGFKGTDNKMQ